MAGKGKQVAEFSFKITDNNTIQVFNKKLDKTQAELTQTGKKAGDVRRNMQAMSGRTETATKSFARMQQGTGGLVQTYAILASTLFAVGAAFRALENAANIQQQEEGFKRLAEITGSSMLSITRSVREAAGGLLEFQAAAQQVAIATAAGFSTQQITELTEGAKRASVALGRDMTDSFNRLIRGVTKAEPELLDELGVILRLDIATRKFAAANGLVAEKLTIAQRRAAVFNEVSLQLKNNFGSFAGEADNLLNPFTKFATTISDVAKDVGAVVASTLSPIVDFLNSSKGALGLLLALIATSLLKQVLPATANISESMKQFSINTQKAMKDDLDRLKKLGKEEKKLSSTKMSTQQAFTAQMKKELKRRGIDEKRFYSLSLKGQKATLTRTLNLEKTKTEKMKALNQKMYARISQVENRALMQFETKYKATMLKAEIATKKFANKFNAIFMGIGATAMRAVAPIAAAIGGLFNAILGPIMLLFTVDMLATMFSSVHREAKNAKDAVKELGSSVEKELSEKIDVQIGLQEQMQKVMEDGTFSIYDQARAVEHLSNQIAAIKTPEQVAERLEEIIKNVETANLSPLVLGEDEAGQRALAGQAVTQFIDAIGTATKENRGKAFESLSTLLQIRGDEVTTTTTPGLKENFDVTERTVVKAKDAAERDIKIIQDAFKAVEEAEDKLAKTRAARNLKETLMDIFPTELIAEMIAKGLFKTTDAFNNFLDELGVINEETRKESVDIKGLGEVAGNLGEAFTRGLPKPSQFGNIVSQFAALSNEIEDIKKKGFERIVDGETISGLEAARGKIAEVLGINIEKNEKAIELGGEAKEQEEERLRLANERLDKIMQENEEFTEILKSANEAILKEKQRLNLIEAQATRIGFFNTAFTRRLKIENKLLGVRVKLDKLIQSENAQSKTNNLIGSKSNDLANQKLDNMDSEIAKLEAQQDLLEAQLNIGKQLVRTLTEAADKAGTQAIKDALLGDKSGSEIKEAFEESMRQATAGFLAGAIMEQGQGLLMKIPGMDKVAKEFGIGKEDPQVTALREVHMSHVTSLATVLTQHVAKIAEVMKVKAPSAIDVPDGTTAATDEAKKDSEEGTEKVVDVPDGTTAATDEAKKDSEEGTEKVVDADGKVHKKDDVEEVVKTDKDLTKTGFSAMFGDIGETMDNLFGDLKGIFTGDGTTMFGEDGLLSNLMGNIFGDDKGKGLGGNFMANLMGEGGLGGALQGLMGGGGLGGILGNLMGGSGGGILGSLLGGGAGGMSGLLKPLLGMIPGVGPLLSILPFAKGGIIGNKMQALEKGGIARYNKGGVATQPTYLVGEGKQNEAVVPLPDNKSIPVDLGKGAGNTNNTNISVNVDNGGASASVTSDGGAKLAQAINAGVMGVLEREQRPGGVLAQG